MKSPATRLTDPAKASLRRTARRRVQAVGPVPAGKVRDWAKRCAGVVEEDGHVAGGLVGDDDVRQAVAVDVGHRDVRRRVADGHRDRCRERPGAVCKAMVTLSFSALATIRSSRPLPVRSAAARLVGRAVVEKAVWRETAPPGPTV